MTEHIPKSPGNVNSQSVDGFIDVIHDMWALAQASLLGYEEGIDEITFHVGEAVRESKNADPATALDILQRHMGIAQDMIENEKPDGMEELSAQLEGILVRAGVDIEKAWRKPIDIIQEMMPSGNVLRAVDVIAYQADGDAAPVMLEFKGQRFVAMPSGEVKP